MQWARRPWPWPSACRIPSRPCCCPGLAAGPLHPLPRRMKWQCLALVAMECHLRYAPASPRPRLRWRAFAFLFLRPFVVAPPAVQFCFCPCATTWVWCGVPFGFWVCGHTTLERANELCFVFCAHIYMHGVPSVKMRSKPPLDRTLQALMLWSQVAIGGVRTGRPSIETSSNADLAQICRSHQACVARVTSVSGSHALCCHCNCRGVRRPPRTHSAATNESDGLVDIYDFADCT